MRFARTWSALVGAAVIAVLPGAAGAAPAHLRLKAATAGLHRALSHIPDESAPPTGHHYACPLGKPAQLYAKLGFRASIFRTSVATYHRAPDVYCAVHAGKKTSPIDAMFFATPHEMAIRKIQPATQSTSSTHVDGGTLRAGKSDRDGYRTCTAEWYRHKQGLTVGLLALRSQHRFTSCTAVLAKLVPNLVRHLADYRTAH